MHERGRVLHAHRACAPMLVSAWLSKKAATSSAALLHNLWRLAIPDALLMRDRGHTVGRGTRTSADVSAARPGAADERTLPSRGK